MIRIYKDSISKMVFIGGSEFGPPSDFRVEVQEGKIWIKRNNINSNALSRSSFESITDIEGNGFSSLQETVDYLNEVFQPEEFLTQGSDASVLDFENVPGVGVSKYTRKVSGRAYLRSNKWATMNDDLYGSSYYQWAEAAGSGQDPIVEWEHLGDILEPGEKINSITFLARTNNTVIQDIEFRVYIIRPSLGSSYSSGIDSDAEIEAAEIFTGNWQEAVSNLFPEGYSGSSKGIHLGKFDINYKAQELEQVRIYWRPVGSFTGTRYFYTSVSWNMER